ncbi:protein indeterminate-domain 7-like [Curcuma longa]|uniref:protein indeterminate-domain 7-like n=1 Tax=Curcuma longa TaxID=136217 RepID=UPI003D9F1960
MSNVTGDGGSFSSGGKSAGEDGVRERSHTDVSAARLPPAKKKKKRNLPGTPDPDAEVIALSPKTLMATNRFVCEICGKGFQRDQNLQLHRRGHNLPWKLRQRSSDEVARKRVYVCPEPTCVHHSPGRALGDLTGIKKHFCRKHGEKKWKCDKCDKKYAVQSDWKAHAKICGTREYKCDCGTVFARRDSFITHRAFCDALAKEMSDHQLNQPLMAAMASSGLRAQDSTPMDMEPLHLSPADLSDFTHDFKGQSPALRALADHLVPPSLDMAAGMLSSFMPNMPAAPSSYCGPMSLCEREEAQLPKPPAESSALMSATALLQKAAQIGATVAGGGNRGAMASMMARPYGMAYGSLINTQGRPYQLIGGCQFFGPAMNEAGVIAGDASTLKHIGRCESGDVMTVDFLGLEGERRIHMQRQALELEGALHQRRMMETLHGLQQQQLLLSAEMENNPPWNL